MTNEQRKKLAELEAKETRSTSDEALKTALANYQVAIDELDIAKESNIDNSLVVKAQTKVEVTHNALVATEAGSAPISTQSSTVGTGFGTGISTGTGTGTSTGVGTGTIKI